MNAAASWSSAASVNSAHAAEVSASATLPITAPSTPRAQQHAAEASAAQTRAEAERAATDRRATEDRATAERLRAELEQTRTDHHDERATLRREAADERAALRAEAREQLAAVLARLDTVGEAAPAPHRGGRTTSTE